MIHQISLNDCLEGGAPPERVLTVSVIDDTAFVRICSVEQGSKHEKHTEVAEISVSLPSLIEALGLLANDADREHLRPLDHDCRSRETRLAGSRLTLAGTGPGSVIGVVTAHRRYTAEPKAESEPGGTDD